MELDEAKRNMVAQARMPWDDEETAKGQRAEAERNWAEYLRYRYELEQQRRQGLADY